MKKYLIILLTLFTLLLVGCENIYTVEFYDGDTLLKTEEVVKGKSATPPIVTKEGYELSGWDQEFNYVKSDLKIYAQFKIKTFTVKFYVLNDLFYEAEVEYGGSVIPPSDPEIEGMHFAGWSVATTNVKSNLVVHAQITDSPTFVVRYIDSLTNQEIHKVYIKSGNNATPPKVDDNKLGYKFSGWSQDGMNIKDNVDIFANYEMVNDTYTITKTDDINVDVATTNLIHNTLVTVQFVLPEGQVVDEFFVNGVSTMLTGKTYQFYIKENTTLSFTTSNTTSVQIFYLNDLHGSILENDSSYSNHEIGLAKIANFINEKRTENPNSIFLAGGDMLQESALSNHYMGVSTLDLLEMMQLDAFVIGNHEFDWGIEEVTKHFIGNNPKYSFPLLAANIYEKGTNNLLNGTQPYHIVERASIKFGIIGYIGEGLESSISASKVKDYQFRNPVQIIADYASHLRTVHEVDFIIAVGHTASHNSGLKNLTGNSKIDLIFNAHTHQSYIDLDGNFPPIIQSRANGIEVGYLEVNNVSGVISINEDSIYNYRYQDSASFKTPDATIQAKINTYLEETNRIFKETIINNSYAIQKAEFARWLAKLIAIKTGSDVGTYNSGGVRDIVPSGPITIEILYKVLPFDNLVKSTNLRGNYVMNEINRNPYYKKDSLTIVSNNTYKIVTNEYVFDHEYNSFQYGDGAHIYEGNIRDWVIEELRLQAAAGYTFSLDNPILSTPVVLRGDWYQIRTFI